MKFTTAGVGGARATERPASLFAGVAMQEAIGELRRALERPLAPLVRDTGTTLAEELERLPGALAIPVQIDWPPWLAARSGSEHCADDRPRTPRRARGPVPGGGARGRADVCESIRRASPSLHAGAADLGRRADVAGGGPRRGGLWHTVAGSGIHHRPYDRGAAPGAGRHFGESPLDSPWTMNE